MQGKCTGTYTGKFGMEIVKTDKVHRAGKKDKIERD